MAGSAAVEMTGTVAGLASPPRFRWAICASLIALPVLIAAKFVHAFAVNVPFWDEWESVPYVLAAISKRLTFADLWRQHNEHRIFFPRLVMLGLYRFGRMDSRVLMYANCAILAFTIAILLAEHLRCRGNTTSAWLSFVPAAWILMSLRQWENLLWGWQIQIFMCSGCLVLALYSLSRATRPAWLCTAVAAGVVCCYSFSSGMLVWPVGLFHIVVTNQGAIRRRVAWIWTCAGVAALAVYFVGYHPPEHHPSPFTFIRHPFHAAAYFLASVGGPVATDLGGAITAGTLLCAGAVATAWWSPTRAAPLRSTMAASLIVFSASASAMMMVGRVGFGPSQALASRYTTITALGVVGLYLLIVQNMDADPRAPRMLAFLLGMLAIGQASVSVAAFEEAKASQQHRRQLARALKQYRSETDAMLAALYPDAAIVRARASILEQHRLSVFARGSATLGSLSGAPPFSVDYINGAPPQQLPPIRAGTPLRVSGWAVDDLARAPAEGVIVFIDDTPGTAARYGLDRPDVAQVLGNPGYRNSGFAAEVPTSSLTAGRHSIGLRVFNAAGTGIYEPPARFTFEVE